MVEVEALARSFTTSVIVVHPTAPELLCVRHPTFGVWMFPGGRIEPGEAPHTAALREVTEEVGLRVMLADLTALARWSRGGTSRLPHPIAMIEEQIPEGHHAGCFYVDIVYVGVAIDATLSLRGEISEAGWFGRRALSELPTSFPIHELAMQVFNDLEQLRGGLAENRG
jgi:8-oxo-dGTP pyrophosphatase MutT (NUDIX family)